jgi:hypothetical protein
MRPIVQSDVKMNTTTMLKGALERCIGAEAKRT